LEYGITTAVLKGANAPDANGETVGGQEDELVMEGDPGCTSEAIPYSKVALTHQQARVHHEPRHTRTNSLSGNGNRNG